MISNDYLILVVGMGLVTYIPRWAPLFFLSQRRLPVWFVEWLDLIPAAILSALLAPVLVTAGEPRQLVMQVELWVAVPTFWFAVKSRSLGGTVIVGMLLYWLAGKI
jgi:branched-subunit amino acid transport protein